MNILVKVILVIISILTLITFCFYRLFLKDQFSTRVSANRFLTAIIEQNYNEAFEEVYYFDYASDQEPTISFEDAKKKWIKRVESLEKNGIVLLKYQDIHTSMDDNYPKGTVQLTIKDKGRIFVGDFGIFFAKRNGKWKVGSISSSDIPTKEFEDATMGYVPSG